MSGFVHHIVLRLTLGDLKLRYNYRHDLKDDRKGSIYFYLSAFLLNQILESNQQMSISFF